MARHQITSPRPLSAPSGNTYAQRMVCMLIKWRNQCLDLDDLLVSRRNAPDFPDPADPADPRGSDVDDEDTFQRHHIPVARVPVISRNRTRMVARPTANIIRRVPLPPSLALAGSWRQHQTPGLPLSAPLGLYVRFSHTLSLLPSRAPSAASRRRCSRPLGRLLSGESRSVCPSSCPSSLILLKPHDAKIHTGVS